MGGKRVARTGEVAVFRAFSTGYAPLRRKQARMALATENVLQVLIPNDGIGMAESLLKL